MSYNTLSFWVLFAAMFIPYWRLTHKWQNRLLLAASYIFYGLWDYRFLFLILLSTTIDYIGGLGVAGSRLSRTSLRNLGRLLVGAAILLCSNIRYAALGRAIAAGNLSLTAVLPHTLPEIAIPIGCIACVLIYGRALPWLYGLPEGRRRRTFLTISMVANLAILAFFKYAGFFASSLAGLLTTLGIGHTSWSALHIILPAGISFYTFQAMSYTIDIYRGEMEPTQNFPDFALFVCFFPHLVAGPIMRAHTLLPQISSRRKLKPGDWEEGLYLVLLGMFKKIVLADNMAPIATALFYRYSHDQTQGLGAMDIMVGLYAFAFQIYGDFSGYSSVARGISKWMGIELVVNFRMPYLAVSPSDFWRRWHISLSTWLRDYLYIPLGGNRKGKLRTYINLMITMVLGGLWHGANWTFIAWGFFHGALLCCYRFLAVKDAQFGGGALARAKWLGQLVLMFHLTCLGWLLFRSDSIRTAGVILMGLGSNFRLPIATIAPLALVVFYALPVFLLESYLNGEQNVRRFTNSHWMLQGITYSYMALMLFVFPAGQAQPFIYFQF